MAKAVNGDCVEYERCPPRATIWLNRPEARNSMTKEMSEAFRDAVLEASADPEVRVIVYRGRGDDFCAGSALDDLDLDHLDAVLTSFDPATHNGLPSIYKGFRRVENDEIPKPTIAVVHGHACGGGFELVCEADFVIAAEDAKLGDMHLPRGIIGGTGTLGNLARIVGVRRTKELILASRMISGTVAEEWGLVNRAVPLADLDALVDPLVERLASFSPRVMRLTKVAYDRSLDADKDTLAALEMMVSIALLADDDAREGIAAFLEKREPTWATPSR
jgi:enoyl-CoA hydratase